MKKLFLAIAIIAALFAYAPLHANAQTAQTVVVTQEYLDSHPELKAQGIKVGDTILVVGNDFSGSTDNVAPIPGQIQGSAGVPGTAPINGGAAGNSNTDTSGYSGPTQGNGTLPTYSGSQSITTCDAIKFNSLLNILIWLKCIAGAIIIPLIFMAAFVVFLWGVLKFMTAVSPEKRKESQRLIWWGLIGLFVMVSVWGILKIAGTTLGIDTTAVPHLQTDYLNQKNATQ